MGRILMAGFPADQFNKGLRKKGGKRCAVIVNLENSKVTETVVNKTVFCQIRFLIRNKVCWTHLVNDFLGPFKYLLAPFIHLRGFLLCLAYELWKILDLSPLKWLRNYVNKEQLLGLLGFITAQSLYANIFGPRAWKKFQQPSRFFFFTFGNLF